MFIKALEVIWALTTFVGAVAAVPYAIWLGVLAWRKQWRKVAYRALIPFTAYLLLTAVVAFAFHRQNATAHHQIFGTKFDLGKPLFEYHSTRAFNGDGYSIAVYELPSAVRERFEQPDAKLLSEFPKRSSDRSRWSSEPWRKAPLEPRFEKYVEFVLTHSRERENPTLTAHFDQIDEALTRDSAYYSFFSYSPGSYVGNVDFFLVDLAAGKLYILNQNT